ncbi:LolA family protein [Portibacter marinus]|uniref:LolA family protein n=1 Tax=Portibacter marinus TaxID=2898660 RepID=UPI001F21912B|nr:outer membrane lipoprotein carrier protein LolA [Portibacter marinus]
MKLFISMFLLAFLIAAAGAQDNAVAIKDPKAEAILDKISSQLSDYESVEMDFELNIEFPGMGEEVQKGKLIQKGDKFYVDTEMQSIYSDGESIWMHMKNNNEVQLSNADVAAAGGFMDPTSLLNLYKTGEYAYAITAEANGNQEIEFKPLDKSSPYSKMRLSVVKGKNKVNSMKVFSKDGSRYTMKLSDVIPNKSYPDAIFVFDKSKYPGVHVEDLRID